MSSNDRAKTKARDVDMTMKKDVGYYDCCVCHSKKKPKKTNVIRELEYLFQCPDCRHVGSFEDFLPSDSMRFLFC